MEFKGVSIGIIININIPTIIERQMASQERCFEITLIRRYIGTNTATRIILERTHIAILKALKPSISNGNPAIAPPSIDPAKNGTVVLVGATTENPSFELNSALLSRCKVFVLNHLEKPALEKIVLRAEAESGRKLALTDEARATLLQLADGDGRYFINLIETVFDLTKEDEVLDSAALMKIVQQRAPQYDKDREGHYNLISALHKSLRGSDPDAALYWAARMIDGGEDPLYLLRRLTRFAMEDVSLADPNALQFAISAWDAYERLGSPEGDLAIAELVVYLGTAPKSTSVYKAWPKALAEAKQTGSLTPPMHILNAPTKLMKELGYNKGYQYDPDTEDGFSGQDYFPEGMGRKTFYQPVERGFEREIQRRLDYWNRLRREKQRKMKEEQ